MMGTIAFNETKMYIIHEILIDGRRSLNLTSDVGYVDLVFKGTTFDETTNSWT